MLKSTTEPGRQINRALKILFKGYARKTKHQFDRFIEGANWRELDVSTESGEIFGRKEIGPERFELSTS